MKVMDNMDDERWNCGADGLPVVAPTAARVTAAVRASGRPGDELLAFVAPELGRAAVEKIVLKRIAHP